MPSWRSSESAFQYSAPSIIIPSSPNVMTDEPYAATLRTRQTPVRSGATLQILHVQ